MGGWVGVVMFVITNYLRNLLNFLLIFSNAVGRSERDEDEGGIEY
jgi:hypothetical protein